MQHPLQLATQYGATATVRFLVDEGGIPVDFHMPFPHPKGGHWNLAHVACKYNAPEILEWAVRAHDLASSSVSCLHSCDIIAAS